MKTTLMVLLALLTPGFLASQSYFFTDLGTLGGTDSYAEEINNKGVIVGTSRTAGNQYSRAFVFRDGAMRELGVFGSDENSAHGINDSGQIVGVDANKGPDAGFLFDSDGQVYALGAFLPEGINNAGVIVGRYDPMVVGGNGWHQGGRLFGGTRTALGLLPGTYRSEALAINSTGVCVGFCYFPGDALTYAFRYGSQLTDIGTLSGGYTRALAINDRGDVVGTSQIREENGNSVRVRHGFLYRDGVMIDLGTLGDRITNHSEAKAINNQGIVVGWSGNRAVIFRKGEAKDLNPLAAKPPGFLLLDAVDINDSGQIIGNALTPSGTTRAFRLDPDRSRPSIEVKGPVRRVSGDSRVAVKGRAKDDLAVDRIEYRVGNARFQAANGGAKWSFKVPLRPGRNTVTVRAIDGAGNISRATTLTVIRS